MPGSRVPLAKCSKPRHSEDHVKSEATTRRRYDTTALVQKLQRERRRGLFLGAGGVAIVIGMVIAYVVTMRGAELPSVPADPSPQQVAKAGTPVPAGTAALPTANGAVATSAAANDDTIAVPSERPLGVVATAHAETTPAAQPETTTVNPATAPAAPAPLPATVRFSVAKNAHVWLDNAPAARDAKEVAAGKHVAKAKIGKRTVTQTFQVASGETVDVHIDAKHHKLVVSRPTVAVSQPAAAPTKIHR